ncbi:MAG TPA: hypothetical protein VFA39_19045 [Steroidobacteraceae bacterium]|nr:hypothetical protein [Steroidobacteraceae bacterium]
MSAGKQTVRDLLWLERAKRQAMQWAREWPPQTRLLAVQQARMFNRQIVRKLKRLPDDYSL